MEFENKTATKPVEYNFENFKQWFVDNNLYDILVTYSPSADAKTINRIVFKRDLTPAEKTALTTKFPMLSEKI